MSFFRHIGKKKVKFAYTLLIRSAEQLTATGWKNGQAVYLQAKRGKKSVQTKVALLEDHSLRWNEALSFVATLYKKEVKDQKEPEWQPKVFALALKTDLRAESKWRVELDLAKFIKDGGQMEVVQSLSLGGKDGPVVKFTVRSHDIERSQPYDPFDFSTPETDNSGDSTTSTAKGGGTLGRGMSKRELKTPHTPGAVSEADRKRLLHRRGESMVMGVPNVESPPQSPKPEVASPTTNEDDNEEDEPTFVLGRGASRKKLDEAEEEKRWDERIRKAITPRAASGGAAAANGFQPDYVTPDRTTTPKARTPTTGGGGGSSARKTSQPSDNNGSDSEDDNNKTSNATTTADTTDTKTDATHRRKESRRGSKVAFDDQLMGPTPTGNTHERRSSLRPERRGSRQGTPFPTIDTDHNNTNTNYTNDNNDDSDDSDDGGLRGRRRIDDAERNRIGGGGGTSTRARDAPSTPAFRRDDDDEFFDRKGAGVVSSAFDSAVRDDISDGDDDIAPERTLSDGGLERESGVADLARYHHDNGRGSELGLPTVSLTPSSVPSKKPHRRGFSRFQHSSGGERPGSRAKSSTSESTSTTNGKKLSIDATQRLALSEEGEDTSSPRTLDEIDPKQLARLTAMHSMPISPRASPSTPRSAR